MAVTHSHSNKIDYIYKNFRKAGLNPKNDRKTPYTDEEIEEFVGTNYTWGILDLWYTPLLFTSIYKKKHATDRRWKCGGGLVNTTTPPNQSSTLTTKQRR